MHGNQAIAEREGKKGEPKASHTDSKRLFVLKAKTLEQQGAFVCLKKFAWCTVCGPWTGRKRRERAFLTTEEQ